MSHKKTLRHLAIIPDGNRRWAKERLLPSVMGHKKGVETARKDAEEHIRQAVKALEGLPFDHAFFDDLAIRSLERAF